MEEIWKDIEGFENLYQVSNLGNVKSLKRKTPFLLKPGKNHSGYLYVALSICTNIKYFSIHRLVAKAFIENKQNLPCVNHKDECKTNNRVDNLEWCTQKYNVNYGTGIERRAKKTAKILINRKDCSKPILQYDKNGNFVNEYPSISECGRKTGINISNIVQVCRGERKSAGKFVWKYKQT